MLSPDLKVWGLSGAYELMVAFLGDLQGFIGLL